MRNNLTKSIYVMTLMTLVMAPFSAFAISRISRTVCGEIQNIDRSKRLIQFLPYSKSEPMTVEVNDHTRLFQDSEAVPFESLKMGIPVELVYKTPLFGERFARRLRWVMSGKLESAVCNGLGGER